MKRSRGGKNETESRAREIQQSNLSAEEIKETEEEKEEEDGKKTERECTNNLYIPYLLFYYFIEYN